MFLFNQTKMRKKSNTLFLSVLAGALLCATGCKDNKEDLSVEASQDGQEQAVLSALNYKSINYRALFSQDHRIKLDDALTLLDDSRQHFSDGATSEALLRSMKAYPEVKEVRYLTLSGDNKLRSGGSNDVTKSDTLAYICNFGEEEGFAILAADDRISSPILAYVESGEYNIEKLNAEQASVLQSIENFIRKDITTFEAQKDSLLQVIKEEPGQENVLRAKKTVSVKIKRNTPIASKSPLIQTRWNQTGHPYNILFSPTYYPAGCGSVAVAQVMAYYQYPANYKGTSYPWSKMRQYANGADFYNRYPSQGNMISKLLKEVGKDMHTSYSAKGSSTGYGEIPAFLSNLGYHSQEFSGFNDNVIICRMQRSQPVISCAQDAYGQGGHFWIIDGYKANELYIETVSYDDVTKKYGYTYTTVYQNVFYHCNWGWGGYLDGYFASGIFNTYNANSYDSGSTTGDPNAVYQFNQGVALYVEYR